MLFRTCLMPHIPVHLIVTSYTYIPTTYIHTTYCLPQYSILNTQYSILNTPHAPHTSHTPHTHTPHHPSSHTYVQRLLTYNPISFLYPTHVLFARFVVVVVVHYLHVDYSSTQKTTTSFAYSLERLPV